MFTYIYIFKGLNFKIFLSEIETCIKRNEDQYVS